MAEYRGVDFLDFLVFLTKRKKIIILTGLIVAVVTYLSIYFFVDERFDATALIIPSEQQSFGGLSSIVSGLPDIPFDIGGFGENATIEKYETIIYSRRTAERMIEEFNLMQEYGVESLEKTIEAFQENLATTETETGAYVITVRAKLPEKAAEMTNYIIEWLNDTIIQLNVQKSQDNRQFLEKRYAEIKFNLQNAEDSLSAFQRETGIYLAEEQMKATFEVLTDFEIQLAQKEVELAIMKNLLGANHPTVDNMESSLNEYRNEFQKLKKRNNTDDALMEVEGLSDKGIRYLRLYRNVEIYTKMLEFILPLYEQARFEEQKNIPVLQVIDYAQPPEKKAYPMRLLSTIVITFIVEVMIIIWMFLTSILGNSSNPKIIYLRNNLFSLKSK